MTRLQDFALGAGICTLLLALVAQLVQAIAECLAVERDRRKASGEVRATARRTPDPARSAPSPDDDRAETDACGHSIYDSLPIAQWEIAQEVKTLIVEDPSSLPDEVFAETVRRAHWDICDEWDRP